MISIKPITAKQTWPIRHTVLYRQRANSEIKILNDADGVHFGLYINDGLVSVVSWFQENQTAYIHKFGTMEAMQNKGYGTKLLNYVIHFSKSKGITKLYCNASPAAVAFYQHFGFIAIGKTCQPDEKEFVEMELDLLSI